MRQAFVEKDFGARSLQTIAVANDICAEYGRQGYDLTLRQLYYQFVARGFIANRDTEYKRLGEIVNDARLAGRMDWAYIVDRTRNLASLAHWDSADSIVRACADQFRLEKWLNQPKYVEVWVEKEALAGVVARVANELDVPYFSCRGYVSQSEMYSAGQRFRAIGSGRERRECHLIHLGDHDPSGIDMTRDIADRLDTFGANVRIHRIALNMDQVEEYNPPPNPAKLTDSRCSGYIERYGDESWELDALAPPVLAALIREEVLRHRDEELWQYSVDAEEAERTDLRVVARHWEDAVRGASTYASETADGEADDGDY